MLLCIVEEGDKRMFIIKYCKMFDKSQKSVQLGLSLCCVRLSRLKVGSDPYGKMYAYLTFIQIVLGTLLIKTLFKLNVFR